MGVYTLFLNSYINKDIVKRKRIKESYIIKNLKMKKWKMYYSLMRTIVYGTITPSGLRKTAYLHKRWGKAKNSIFMIIYKRLK